jgi:hypothetical protein
MEAPLTDGLVGGYSGLELVRGVVRDVRAGWVSALLMEGEAGMGESRLVRSLIDEARTSAAVVFRGAVGARSPVATTWVFVVDWDGDGAA